ncbi:MAG: hypothetical protein JSV29_01005 [Candidatus Bathyarchaeota archaeon]|nr:MAG: hypothetical protein JSV29_01005 [Candidatus Bathyarchaeota archaeon]
MAKKEEAKAEVPMKDQEKIEVFGAKMYVESAKALREVGARVALSVGAAIIIWVFGQLVFIPISKGMEPIFEGYPMDMIISFIIVVALAVIIFTVFLDIRKLTSGIAGVLAYEFGKASGEVRVESLRHYRIALDGIIYVIVISLAYLLFAPYLGEIHAAIPAVVLILIVIWAVFALWRSCRAIATEISRYTTKWAEELEKRTKKS